MGGVDDCYAVSPTFPRVQSVLCNHPRLEVEVLVGYCPRPLTVGGENISIYIYIDIEEPFV